MKFIPNASIKKELLHDMGFSTIDDLFSDIPNNIKRNHLNLPPHLSEQEVEQKMRTIAQKNTSFCQQPGFQGGGIKPHYIPAAVKSIISRSEFYTAYTPYQAEASQGFLQAIFEYQSMIAELTAMDIANASLYDSATALGEAALMSARVTRKKKVLIASNISTDKKSVLQNYCKGAGITVQEIPFNQETGKVDMHILEKTIDDTVAGFYMENPNFYGVLEDDVETINMLVKKTGSLFIVGVDPLALGIIKPPGDYGADIVIGEGRCFGNPMDFGGSSLGIFACKQQYLRQLPGRIIGLANDATGKRGFCMTMQTREQHIRREKATSNICTNEGLNMLAACVHLSLLGGQGLEALSMKNYAQAHHVAKKITAITGYKKVFTSDFFNEVLIRCPNAQKLQLQCLKQHIQGGLALASKEPFFHNCLLFGVTELHTDESINQLLSAMNQVM